MIHNTIIICGSSRSGKTTLAKLTNKYSKNNKGLIFEGLFPAYLSRLSYTFKAFHKGLFEEYIDRPRFIDEKKSKTISPKTQLGEVSYDQESLFIGSLYKSFGKEWVIADLHAELYYKSILSNCPNTHFCMIIRDPRDCVCAGLYWQDFPNAHKNRKRWFYKYLFSWLLSSEISNRIHNEHKNNITTINFNNIRTDKTAQELLNLNNDWQDSVPQNSYYSYLGNNYFSTPGDQKQKGLLSIKELSIIQAICKEHMSKHGYTIEELPSENVFWQKIIKFIIINISKLSPSLARGTIDLLFYPIEHLKKQIDRLKQFIKDVRDFKIRYKPNQS